MKKFKVSRKILSAKEADTKIQNAFQSMQNERENILYWLQRIGKPLEPIDSFILMTYKLTPETAIAGSKNRMEYLHRKIYEDYGRFTKVKNKLF